MDTLGRVEADPRAKGSSNSGEGTDLPLVVVNSELLRNSDEESVSSGDKNMEGKQSDEQPPRKEEVMMRSLFSKVDDGVGGIRIMCFWNLNSVEVGRPCGLYQSMQEDKDDR